MSEKLIPLALSSQIDNNGLEHIHAAIDSSGINNRPIYIGISGDMDDGLTGNPESGTYTSAGGVLPHTFAITDGTFPAGLTLASDGSWSGTRTTVGVYTWTVTVTDTDGNTASLIDSSETIETFETLIQSLGPLLWWKLDETAGTTAADSSGNNRPGTYAGNYTLNADGVHWNDATGRVTRVVADGEIGIASDSSWCVMGVVTFDDIGSVYPFGRIAELRQTSSAGYNFSLYAYSSGGSSSVLPRHFGSAVAGNTLDYTGLTIVNGTRYLVGLEVNSTTRTLYINGTAVASEPVSGDATLGGELMLTGSFDAAANGFAGRSKHTLLFDYAIGAANHLALAELLGVI